MKTIRDIKFGKNIKILVRVDFNVPIKDGVVVDDFRIRVALPTINFLKEKGAIIILTSHLESIDGENSSLEPVARHLEKLSQPVIFIKDFKKADEIMDAKGTKDAPVFLLENLRFFTGEKANDEKFSAELASLADIYVNEAFSCSHREHASIVSIPKVLPSYTGLQFEKEVAHLSRAFDPTHPFLFILGGAKFDTKLPLIERFTKIADTVFLGGALGNDALKAKGFSVGQSKVSKGIMDISGIVNDPHIMIPVDSIIQGHAVKELANIAPEDHIFDAGPKTLKLIKHKIDEAKFILWNGPLGPYEEGYTEATEAVAKMIAERTKDGAGKDGVESIVGGGDTLAAIMNLKIEDQYTFVSSGGGAMLDFLVKGTLPGIEALKG